jgi:DNA repair protein RAD50
MITANEARVDSSKMLDTEIKYNASDIEEKTKKLDKLKADADEAKYAEKGRDIKACEEQREELNTELRTLSLQADSRAKLELKRADVSKKRDDIKVV